jgi:hypothetical protein
MMAFSGVTSQCEERGSAGTNFEIAIAVVLTGTKRFFAVAEDDWSLVSESCFLLALIPSAQMQCRATPRILLTATRCTPQR